MPGWGAGTHPGQAAGLAGQAGWRPQPLRGEAGWTWPHAPCSLHRYASRAYPGHAARRAWPLHHQVYRLPKPVTPAGTARDWVALVLAGSMWQKVPAVRLARGAVWLAGRFVLRDGLVGGAGCLRAACPQGAWPHGCVAPQARGPAGAWRRRRVAPQARGAAGAWRRGGVAPQARDLMGVPPRCALIGGLRQGAGGRRDGGAACFRPAAG
jgi:hypothetical protein